MAWPDSDVNTSNCDSDLDSPTLWRADCLDLMVKFNQLRNHVTNFWRNLLATADAASARSGLGLGSMATQNANSVNISGGSINVATLRKDGTDVATTSETGALATQISLTAAANRQDFIGFVKSFGRITAVGVILNKPTA